jgi:hypothetical protein
MDLGVNSISSAMISPSCRTETAIPVVKTQGCTLLVLCFIMVGTIRAQVISVANTTPISQSGPAYNLDTQFGYAVATVGTDKLLVGAPGAMPAFSQGVVYLYGTNGALLQTFLSPFPAGEFGAAVAALGEDRVLIGDYNVGLGAPNAGAVHLFGTNGTLLFTFTNPTPASMEWFGWSVAAMGMDKVLVGSPRALNGANIEGAAYLFTTNGLLLNTFTNPNPALSLIGFTVTAVGTNHVLVGGTAAAYLFHLDGTLVTTFANPNGSNSRFGWAAAVMGPDRLLIGDWTSTGAAYLFNTNGSLLMTFTNPPGSTGEFGRSVVPLGTDRVAIGASGGRGALCFFKTNGTLVGVVTNPPPNTSDHFGYAIASVGANRIFVGATGDTGPNGYPTGAAHLLSLSNGIPRLGIETTTNLPPGIGVPPGVTALRIFWPNSSVGFRLENNFTASPNGWTSVAAPPWLFETNDTEISFYDDNQWNSRQFYRLVQP